MVEEPPRLRVFNKMINDQAPNSYLIADVGSTTTRVVFYDVVNGSYALIARAEAPTTAVSPWSNVTVGLQEAIQKITDISGRRLLSRSKRLIQPSYRQQGVDQFLAVSSAASPLRVVLVGLLDDVSLRSAQRVLLQNYATAVDHFSLSDQRSEEEQLKALVQAKPDLIFIVGGTDGGIDQRLEELIETVALGAELLAQQTRPRVLFAGNKSMRQRVREIIAENSALFIADNIRPNLATEKLDDAAQIINELHEDLRINALPGVHIVRQWNDLPIHSTASGLAIISHYLANAFGEPVLTIDMGSDSTTFISAGLTQFQTAIHTEIGSGRSISKLLSVLSPDVLAKWVPFECSDGELLDFLHNKALNPQTLPLTENELYLEQAAVRELLGWARRETAVQWQNSTDAQLPEFKHLLVCGKSLTQAPYLGQALLMLLDGLQPKNIFSVMFDTLGILPGLGALAVHNPAAVVQILAGNSPEAGNLLKIDGWVVVPSGTIQLKQKVLTVVVEYASGQILEMEVEFGSLERLPIDITQQARVTITPLSRFDIGYGPNQPHTFTWQRGKFRLNNLGLIVDARKRPLQLPEDDEIRIQTLRQWAQDMGN